MGRKPCCDKVGLKRGPWTIDEDHKLMSFILGNGIHCWRTVPKLAGLLRCGKSCRLRWINYLRPDLKRGGFTEAEEDQIIELHAALGNRWSKIASHFDGRTDNEIKNHWNTRIKKRLKEMGVDLASHKSAAKPKQTGNEQPKDQMDADSDSTKEQPAQTAIREETPKVTNADTQHEGSEDVVVDNNKLSQFEHPGNDDDLLSDYDIFNGSLEVLEHWLNEDSLELDGRSSSTSFSLNAPTSETSTGLHEAQHSDSVIRDDNDPAYLHQWFDEMDSFFGFSSSLDITNHYE
uniref:Uncharacterized protein n=1 Tax=Kalanchoe fedtschenkoi TaxID=63787 RepID=A0A7N0T7Z3_KALFE